jgi:hypothetical protein
MKRRVLIGLGLAVAGSYFALDPAARAEALLNGLRQWWPFLLLGLAGLNLLRSVIDTPSLLAPAALTAVAAVALAGIGAPFWDRLVAGGPLLVAGIGVGMVVAAMGTPARVVSVLWTRRSYAKHRPLPARTELVCVAGELRHDLRSASIAGTETLVARLVLGYVVVVIPSGWRCHLANTPPRSIRISERGAVPPAGPTIALEVSGGVGWLIIRRV